MKSIIPQDPQVCYLCGRRNATDVHHVYPGANRQVSDQYGLTVRLCRDCHRDLHDKGINMAGLQSWVQRIAMEHYGWNLDEWITRFGKDYREIER